MKKRIIKALSFGIGVMIGFIVTEQVQSMKNIKKNESEIIEIELNE